jgi:outer membrane protein TolC
MRILVGAGLALALPGALYAEPLTFEAALERAAREAPSLRASEAGIAAARAQAIAADRLPDPTLELGIRDFPVTGPDAGEINSDDFTMRTIGVTQEFTNPAKRRARATRAGAEIGIAEAGFAVEAQTVRLETALAWIDLYYAKRRLDQLKLLDRSLGELQATVSARLASGSARPSQALEPDQLRAAVTDRRSALEADVAKARARLVRFTGDPEADAVGDPPPLAVELDELVAGADSLPRLRALDAQARLAEAEVRLARSDKRPDWRVSAMYGRREPRFGDLVSVQVSIDLPLFAKRRQDPIIAARASEAERARLDRVAAEREVGAALAADLADHEMHHRQLENAREVLVPLARRRGELDQASYAAGTLDLGSALLSTLALAEAEVDALAREAEIARDVVRLNFTYGPITDGSAGDDD